MTNVYAFICAVANTHAHSPLPDGQLCRPWAEYLEGLRIHGLTGRFARILAQAHKLPFEPALIEPALIEAVHTEQARVEDRFRRQLAEAVRIQKHLASRGCETLLIKGPSVHLVSGGAAPPRWAADLDIVIPNASKGTVGTAVQHYFAELGFLCPENDNTGLHEAGHFTKALDGDNTFFFVDAHHSFPIWGYPDLDLVDLALPGCVDIDRESRGGNAVKSLIDFSAMMREAVRISTEFGDVVTVGPEMAALIGCGNLLKDDIKPHWFAPRVIRLGHVAEIVDLCDMPSFNHEKFQNMVVRWHAEDSVAFAAQACEDYLGRAPLILRELAGESRAFTHTLWSRNDHPILLKTESAVRDPQFRLVSGQRMDELVRRLGHAEVSAYVDFRSDPSLTLGLCQERTFTHHRGDRQITADIWFAWTTDTLITRVVIDTDDFVGSECLMVNFGDPALEFYRHSPYPGDAAVPHPKPRVRNRSLSDTATEKEINAVWGHDVNGRSTLEFTLPWNILSQGRSDEGHVSFILGLQDFVSYESEKNVSVLTPVILRRDV